MSKILIRKNTSWKFVRKNERMFAKVHVHPFKRKTFTKLTFEKLFKSEAVHVHRFSQKFSKSRGKIGKNAYTGQIFRKLLILRIWIFWKLQKVTTDGELSENYNNVCMCLLWREIFRKLWKIISGGGKIENVFIL